MGIGHLVRPHLVQDHGNAGIGDLPGSFRAGEARADHMDAVVLIWGYCHGPACSAFRREVEFASRKFGRLAKALKPLWYERVLR
jgi:hypothetical protein